jgi:cell division septation protein DedD
MNIRTFSFIIFCALLLSSCKTTKNIAQTPPLPEVNSKTEITVRTESVKPIDETERTMYGFYVIIGSFRSVENARRECTSLVNEGFTPVILENENGLFRISVGGYDEENAARAKIAGIRAAYENHRDVWLLIRK